MTRRRPQDDPDGNDLDDKERYRRAAEDALQLLDWSIGYLYGIRKGREAHALSRGRSVIRENLLGRDAEPTPADSAEPDAA